ncbi:MAG: hypothetical protein JW966_03695, partial [Anaerolineae bacterium]|nr:hypothetical protein [Anaerolineae bacterium]
MRYQRSLLIRLAFLLVILAVAVTACDSGDDTDSETQPTVAATITPPLTKTPIPTFTPFPTFTATQPFIAPPTSTQLVLRPTSAVVVPTSTPLVPSATPYPYDIRITYPVDGSTIAGYVTVIGSASHPRFVQYALEWGPEPNPGNLWYPFLSPPQRTNIVQNGALGSWDTKIVRDGIYRVRLHVWLNDGTDTDYVIGSIRVSNSQPTAVPTFTHTPRPNQPPTIDPIASQKVQTAKVINIPVTTRDADNDTVNLYVTSDNTAVAIAQVVSGSGITVAGVSAGTATITVTANDNHGGTVSTAFIATVEGENHAPTINPIGSQTLKTGESRNITITVSDPDGNTLTVSAVSDNTTIVNASAPNTSTVSLAAGNTPGTANVTVTANDGKGGINNVTFQVAVTAPNLPSINAIADQSMTVGDTLDVAYTVVDGSGTPITNTVTAQVASGNTAIATADIPAAGTIRLNAAGAGTAAIT